MLPCSCDCEYPVLVAAQRLAEPDSSCSPPRTSRTTAIVCTHIYCGPSHRSAARVYRYFVTIPGCDRRCADEVRISHTFYGEIWMRVYLMSTTARSMNPSGAVHNGLSVIIILPRHFLIFPFGLRFIQDFARVAVSAIAHDRRDCRGDYR